MHSNCSPVLQTRIDAQAALAGSMLELLSVTDSFVDLSESCMPAWLYVVSLRVSELHYAAKTYVETIGIASIGSDKGFSGLDASRSEFEGALYELHVLDEAFFGLVGSWDDMPAWVSVIHCYVTDVYRNAYVLMDAVYEWRQSLLDTSVV